ncbi:flavodoxin family protein [Glycomyces algeriensis]|jgi:multimeric flavodoxin WrbA|uniref:FMN reductase n=1 Tax=Glycomyces algeriensis TaxID=256037 RepID=A0A9W6GA17_9ACTN|nr:flavodoxin family protein [Glycomyces algeriensis]MDA1364380.1 flavodoxin family protein [Glycomyces algeriensis]MDR7350413.1 multimeric flavodoxin WrbA [Glycomyces algeriensis]GLI43120.1 FMN reductase [Glycomyces algeriensis]
MKILTINGSERSRGSTWLAVQAIVERARARGCETREVDLAEQRVTRCDCGRCNSRTDPCPVDDDVGTIVAAMVEADAVFLAAPVHGFGLSSLMQTFVERAGVGHLRFERPLTNTIGAAVVIGRRYGHLDVHAQLLHNLLLNRFIVVGSGFPVTIHSGGEQGVLSDTEGMEALHRTVDRIIDIGNALAESGTRLPRPSEVERRVGRTS